MKLHNRSHFSVKMSTISAMLWSKLNKKLFLSGFSLDLHRSLRTGLFFWGGRNEYNESYGTIKTDHYDSSEFNSDGWLLCWQLCHKPNGLICTPHWKRKIYEPFIAHNDYLSAISMTNVHVEQTKTVKPLLASIFILYNCNKHVVHGAFRYQTSSCGTEKFSWLITVKA